MSSLGLKLNHQIDIDSKTIYLVGEVDVDLYRTLVNGLLAIPSGSVNIVLNTDGGCVYQALAMYDLIKSRGNCTIITEGQCMSAGIIILMAAKYRMSRPNCFLMVHYGEEINSSQSEVLHNHRLTRILKKIIADRVLVSPKRVAGWFHKETFFSALQAVEVGLIDGVLK